MSSASEYPVGNRLREMAAGDRPQERLERLGPGALSDTELLAMLLRSGTRGQDVLTLAKGVPVEHNDQLVSRVVELGRIAQRTPMTPAEAKDLLQVKRR